MSIFCLLSLQTCLRESDGSDEEDSLSNHSEDRFSEGSWDRVERKDTEVSDPHSFLLMLQLIAIRESNTSFPDSQVTRWVPDHMASHCFNCDSEFWIAKRRHHCRWVASADPSAAGLLGRPVPRVSSVECRNGGISWIWESWLSSFFLSAWPKFNYFKYPFK